LTPFSRFATLIFTASEFGAFFSLQAICQSELFTIGFANRNSYCLGFLFSGLQIHE
jgi:hypothetical protein